MRGAVSMVLAATTAAACSETRMTLPYPPEVLDGSSAAAILLLQADENLESSVLEAELLVPATATPRRYEFEGLESARFRLLAYSERAPLDALALVDGPLPTAAPGEGVPVPVPSASFVSATLEGTEFGWRSVGEFDAASLPLRVPEVIVSSDCTDVSIDAVLIPGLDFVRPQALIALDRTRAVAAGQFSGPDGRSTRESLFLLLSNLDDTPSFESLAPPLAGECYRGLIESAPGELLASSDGGWFTRVKLATREVQSVQSLNTFGYWQLSLGEDGTIVAFDTRNMPDRPRGWPHLIDPTTLEATSIEAPEPLLHVAVVRRDLMYGGGQRRLYRFERGAWMTEHEADAPITELLRLGDRIVAMVGKVRMLERGPSGEWVERPHQLSIFDLAVGAFFSDGRLIFGGGVGVLAQYRDGRWCNIPRALSREILALAPVPAAAAGLAITYSEKTGDWAGVTRLQLHP